MLNFAFRELLGNHVEQKGSIVFPEKFRVDFSHGKPVHPEELKKLNTLSMSILKLNLMPIQRRQAFPMPYVLTVYDLFLEKSILIQFKLSQLVERWKTF